MKGGVMKPPGPVRCGLLGCSDIARRKFVPALLESDEASLVAVASRDRERAAAFVPGVTYAAQEYGELLANPAVELVYLSLPNHLHEEWAVRALESGKHVICEKPLALSAAAVERMVTSAGRCRRLLFENLMFLHHPQHAAVRELVAAGIVGRVAAVRSVFTIPMPAAGNYRLDPHRGGGAFHDLARYPLATALRYLSGDIRSFHGVSRTRDGLTVGMEGGARTTADEIFAFVIAFGLPYDSHYEIVGDRGAIRVERAYTTPAGMANRIIVRLGTGDASFTVPPHDHFRLMIAHVCGLVRGGGDFREVGERTLRLARLADVMEKGCDHGE